MNKKLFRYFIIFIFFVFIFTFNAIQNVHAIDGSKLFTSVLFVSGLGASFAGAITQGQANAIYDDYLHSAVQSDMDRLIGDYKKKNQQSVITSRVGIVLTITAVFISLFDANNSETQKTSDNISSKYKLPEIAHTDIKNDEISLSIRNRF